MSGALEAKKLVSLLATSTSMTGLRKEVLEHVSCIYYPVRFKKDKVEVQALIDSRIEVNRMAPANAKKFVLRLRKINVGA